MPLFSCCAEDDDTTTIIDTVDKWQRAIVAKTQSALQVSNIFNIYHTLYGYLFFTPETSRTESEIILATQFNEGLLEFNATHGRKIGQMSPGALQHFLNELKSSHQVVALFQHFQSKKIDSITLVSQLKSYLSTSIIGHSERYLADETKRFVAPRTRETAFRSVLHDQFSTIKYPSNTAHIAQNCRQLLDRYTTMVVGLSEEEFQRLCAELDMLFPNGSIRDYNVRSKMIGEYLQKIKRRLDFRHMLETLVDSGPLVAARRAQNYLSLTDRYTTQITALSESKFGELCTGIRQALENVLKDSPNREQTPSTADMDEIIKQQLDKLAATQTRAATTSIFVVSPDHCPVDANSDMSDISPFATFTQLG